MSQSFSSERGNILVYALIGIVLIGALTVALNQGNDGGKDIGSEQNAIRVTEIQRYAAKIQEAVATVLGSGVSESDLRFAHPKASNDYGDLTVNTRAQVFHPNGGNAPFSKPPAGLQITPDDWEYYGHVSLPQIGSDKADLIMVMPNLTEEACEAINRQLGFDMEEPIPNGVGTGGCLNAGSSERFVGVFDQTPNVIDPTTFTRIPAPQACVACGTDYHYYYVLQAR